MVRNTTQIEALKQLLPQCLLPDQVRIGTQLAQALEALRQGRHAPMPLERWTQQAQASIASRQARATVLRKLAYPPELPITARHDELVAALRQHQVIIVAGETGSGKTTQLPKLCLEAGLGLRARIGCTQPRRVAALSIARRLAEELDVTLGREVGSKIRFADQTRPETSVKVMTDGILLAEIQGDPLLAEYEAILLDEAHERSINIDFLLGYLKQLLTRRHDLKLIITSATIDTEVFSRAFDRAPVIAVSGRVFPVEVRYAPLDEHAEEEGEVTYIDAAVRAVEQALEESQAGDVLVFMPSERDIRETCDRLESRQAEGLEIVPLFGRLTAGEQQRVFAPGPRRRVVVATNIAETSLTVPRIRYVIDTGLARLSRYHPGTRSRRLPIEPIAQSSAKQRQGRCGRVADGVCVRLFSEEDFRARRPFIEPEIQRCNLADVVLRLKAFRLGEIETFPFLDPPSPAAVRGAYDLLQELGALDAQRALTPIGQDLARLPVDPALGRMILEAHHEGALREVLVIAAGLSIQDPRERPLDQKDAAEAAHRRFQEPRSDFLTLLNIWHAYHDTLESLRTQNQMRKFCKTHFLSFVRMREWRDLYAQVEETLEDLGDFHWNPRPADYASIHRSILTGLWGHVGRREERNAYRVPGQHLVHIFPGSALFEKPSPPAQGKRAKPRGDAPPPAGQPDWMVAGELVETTRPYARTVAAIEPEWIIELAAHLLRTTHEHPRWDVAAGNVLVTERLTLRGLVLRERAVSYVDVNPVQATEMFIRSALLDEASEDASEEEPVAANAERSRRWGEREAPARLRPREPNTARPTLDVERVYPFVAHNRRLREKIELWQTRMSHRVVPDLGEALFAFYAQRLQAVGSFPDLNRVLKASGNTKWLFATEADLLGAQHAGFDRAAFPDTVNLAGQTVPVLYAYAPGEEHDGVTFQLTAPLIEQVDPEQLDWAVPALREERVLHLLQALPKMLRRRLMPLPATAREIVQAVPASTRTFLGAMSDFVRRKYGVEIPLSAWPVTALPPHLRPRFEVVGTHERKLGAGRDLNTLREQLQQRAATSDAQAWKQVVARWERYGLTGWDLGDLPERIPAGESSGLPLYAYPGLQVENGEVNFRLFRKPEEATAASREGVPRLAERVLAREFAWLQQDLRTIQPFQLLYASIGPADELMDTAWENLRRHLLGGPLPALTAQGFADYVESARRRMKGLVPQFADWVGAILRQRQEALACRHPLPSMKQEVDALLPRPFLRHIPFEQLRHVPRYLQALLIRAQRALLQPAKDAEKARRVQPYVQAAQSLRVKPPGPAELQATLRRFIWLVEELKVSVFAQELGTAEPVSSKRLDALLAELRAAGGNRETGT